MDAAVCVVAMEVSSSFWDVPVPRLRLGWVKTDHSDVTSECDLHNTLPRNSCSAPALSSTSGVGLRCVGVRQSASVTSPGGATYVVTSRRRGFRARKNADRVEKSDARTDDVRGALFQLPMAWRKRRQRRNKTAETSGEDIQPTDAKMQHHTTNSLFLTGDQEKTGGRILMTSRNALR